MGELNFPAILAKIVILRILLDLNSFNQDELRICANFNQNSRVKSLLNFPF